ncbi:uncharacterized protein [Phaenicophaeus curvirostris]|uniref:uncharacterized protein isoform X2 n=1 Tax=Phaenicophaeus curvirostris TaxID=33595 RepID=UPI0037F0BD33
MPFWEALEEGGEARGTRGAGRYLRPRWVIMGGFLCSKALFQSVGSMEKDKAEKEQDLKQLREDMNSKLDREELGPLTQQVMNLKKVLNELRKGASKEPPGDAAVTKASSSFPTLEEVPGGATPGLELRGPAHHHHPAAAPRDPPAQTTQHPAAEKGCGGDNSVGPRWRCLPWPAVQAADSVPWQGRWLLNQVLWTTLRPLLLPPLQSGLSTPGAKRDKEHNWW